MQPHQHSTLGAGGIVDVFKLLSVYAIAYVIVWVRLSLREELHSTAELGVARDAL